MLKQSLVVAIAAIVGSVLGAGLLWLSLHAEIQRLDSDIDKLDARSAAVARLDSAKVKRCLEWSDAWKLAKTANESKVSAAYSDLMNGEGCDRVMNAIRRLR